MNARASTEAERALDSSTAHRSEAVPELNAYALDARSTQGDEVIDAASPSRGSGHVRRCEAADGRPVRILAIGGSTRPGSSSERALRIAADAARASGAHVDLITSRDLILPIYDTESQARTAAASAFVSAVSEADGLIIASPGYHGGVSGMIKNALDYVEDLRTNDRVYLEGVGVGCIAVAFGWQATGTTLQGLRTITHALRGWPTPFGATINTLEQKFSASGECLDPTAALQLETVGRQVVEFALMRQRVAT